MRASTPRTADLIHPLTCDAFEAEGEGRAWEAAAGRACGLYLETLERLHALEVRTARARRLDLRVDAGRRRPPPRPPKASAPGRRH